MTADDSARSAEWPNADDLFPAMTCAGLHPTCLPIEQLLLQCNLRTQRRSGPGGQHRNKTSTGVFLEHQPTGQIGEATERRSQADNRAVAVERLRLKMAVVVRSQAISEPEPHVQLRQKFSGGPLKISIRNSDFAAVQAILLNDLWNAGGQPSLVAANWRVSTSAITRLLKQHAPAMTMVNAYREHHGRLPLR